MAFVENAILFRFDNSKDNTFNGSNSRVKHIPLSYEDGWRKNEEKVVPTDKTFGLADRKINETQ